MRNKYEVFEKASQHTGKMQSTRGVDKSERTMFRAGTPFCRSPEPMLFDRVQRYPNCVGQVCQHAAHNHVRVCYILRHSSTLARCRHRLCQRRHVLFDAVPDAVGRTDKCDTGSWFGLGRGTSSSAISNHSMPKLKVLLVISLGDEDRFKSSTKTNF